MYGAVPPAALAVAVPSEAPQFASVPVTFSVRAGGSVIVAESINIQPTASVMVTE